MQVSRGKKKNKKKHVLKLGEPEMHSGSANICQAAHFHPYFSTRPDDVRLTWKLQICSTVEVRVVQVTVGVQLRQVPPRPASCHVTWALARWRHPAVEAENVEQYYL